MATTVALDIAGVLIQTTETTLIAVIPVNHEYAVPVIRFANNAGTQRTLTIYNKPTAGAGTNAEAEVRNFTVEPNSIYEHGPMVLSEGRRITALIDTNDLLSAQVHGWDTDKTP